VLSRRINVLDVVFDGLQLAGFQVSITGRFWVSTEATRRLGHESLAVVAGGLLTSHAEINID
jgi:hypothetical protein